MKEEKKLSEKTVCKQKEHQWLMIENYNEHGRYRYQCQKCGAIGKIYSKKLMPLKQPNH